MFEVKDLPAGRYTITATRAGFLRQSYGQRRPGEPGRPIEIADGQAVTGIDFALQRMSVISGRVSDEVGGAAGGRDGLPDAGALLPRQAPAGAGRHLEFRTVPAGDYLMAPID